MLTLAPPLPRFEGNIDIRYILGGKLVQTLKDFRFFDSRGNEWNVKAGLISDGATIPPLARPFIGGPFDGLHRDGAIVHDQAYEANGELSRADGSVFRYSRADADKMLWDAMACRGEETAIAVAIYWPVRAFGWWPWRNDGKRKRAQGQS